MKSIRELVTHMELHAELPPGSDERFSGYAVMGLPFSSGYILGLRRFPASSLGSAYTTVWIRRPNGSWQIYSDIEPVLSCPRYFGSALEATSIHDIRITWLDDASFTVGIHDDVDLQWNVRLAVTPATRVLSAVAGHLPDGLWRSDPFLKAMGAAAGPSLHLGHLALEGSTPNRQHFRASPRRVWTIRESGAFLNGDYLGHTGPVPEQARLGDFWMPQRGLFMIGSAVFEAFDPAKHVLATTAR
jgi:hypothetical protein